MPPSGKKSGFCIQRVKYYAIIGFSTLMQSIWHVMDMIELGTALKEARLIKQRSQQEVCDLLGLSRATLSKLENGRLPELGIRKVMNICDLLGLQITLFPASSRPTLQQLQAENKAIALAAEAPPGQQRVRRKRSNG